MSDPRKSETLDLRVRFRFSKLIDPDLYQVLSNLSESERSSLLHAMITRSALGVAMPMGKMIQAIPQPSGESAHPASSPASDAEGNPTAVATPTTRPIANQERNTDADSTDIAPPTSLQGDQAMNTGVATRIWRFVTGQNTRRPGMES